LDKSRDNVAHTVVRALFTSRRAQIVTLVARHALPAIYDTSEFAEIGGLMSYGANETETSRLACRVRVLTFTHPLHLDQQVRWTAHTLASHKLPAVYFERFFVTAGGLISYGPDFLDQYRRYPTGLISSTSIAARLAISIVSSKAKSPPTFRCKPRPSTSWPST